MVRPRVEHHVPGKRKRGESWRVFWRGHGRVYEVTVGHVSEADAEVYRLEIDLALRKKEWPKWAARLPAVRRFLTADSGPAPDDLLESGPTWRQGAVCQGATDWSRLLSS